MTSIEYITGYWRVLDHDILLGYVNETGDKRFAARSLRVPYKGNRPPLLGVYDTLALAEAALESPRSTPEPPARHEADQFDLLP